MFEKVEVYGNLSLAPFRPFLASLVFAQTSGFQNSPVHLNFHPSQDLN